MAQALAQRLSARAVIVSDLRRKVDVNKNPLTLQKRVRYHSLRYQNEVFRDLPRLVIEIHGHVSGQYPIELSSGFDLDPSLPGDTLFLERLCKLQKALPAQISGKIGQSVEVGVYPIDRDVKKTATNTYTFQKIRRARNRVGLEWYGLHIELAPDLRRGGRARTPGHVEALADALATSIDLAFDPLPGPEAVVPPHADISDEESVTGASLHVAAVPEEFAEKNIALLNPKDISTLGLLDGDLVSLYNHGERLRVPVASSSRIPANKIAIPARLRRQLDLNPGDAVTVLQSVTQAREAPAKSYHSFVIGGVRPAKSPQVWAHPTSLQYVRADSNGFYRGKGPFQSSETSSVQLVPEAQTTEHIVIASDTLMRKLTLTIGDILMIEKSI